MSHIVTKLRQKIEADGRWIAEIVDVPGVMAYGATEKEAVASAQSPCAPHPSRPHRTKKEPTENCYRLYRSLSERGQWPSRRQQEYSAHFSASVYAIKSQRGSHVILTQPERGDYV